MNIKTLASNKLDKKAVLGLNELQKQLRGENARNLGIGDWRRILDQPALIMIVGYEGENIAGMSILRWHDLPGGRIGTLEDVVVDSQHRGKGYGEMMVVKIIEIARKRKVALIDLTTASEREAANKLYQKLGWEKRETNIYRLYLK